MQIPLITLGELIEVYVAQHTRGLLDVAVRSQVKFVLLNVIILGVLLGLGIPNVINHGSPVWLRIPHTIIYRSPVGFIIPNVIIYRSPVGLIIPNVINN